MQRRQAHARFGHLLPTLIDHLTSCLDVDARSHLSSLLADGPSKTPHAWLHQSLGAVGRRLRADRPGIAVHAGVVALDDGRGLLILGSTGSGKSTLTALVAERLAGAVVTDDSAWIDHGTACGFGAPLAIRDKSPFYAQACAASAVPAEPRMLALPSDLGLKNASTTTISHVVVAGYGRSDAAVTRLSPTVVFAHLLGSLFQTAGGGSSDELLRLAGAVVGHQIAYHSADTSIAAVQAALAAEPLAAAVSHRVSRAELNAHAFGESIEAARFGDDAVLWHRATGQVVCVDGWPARADVPSELRRQLNSLGFMSVEAP